MEFKLNLDNGRASVPTHAYSMAQARSASSSAASKGRLVAQRAAGVAVAGARVGATGARAAGAAAYRAGTAGLAKAKAMKERFHTWLYERPDTQNFFLLITNTLYLALTLTVLVLTLLVVQEHVDDFKRNEYSQHRDPATGAVKQYPPCCMPTPDSMYLLQAIGALPAAGWDGASLEPDYKKWMQKVDRALCARIIPGVDVPDHYPDLADCKVGANYVDYSTEHVEELLALGFMMEEPSLTPTIKDYTDQTLITAKKDLFEKRICLEDDDADTGVEPLYSKQQRDAYGELKTRVARAYVAAMPAFARYHKERAECAEHEDFEDPFDSFCKHSCHIRVELEAAANEQRVMWDAGYGIPATSFTKQLYRLFALSLAGYRDRLDNNGECFRNRQVYAANDAIPTGFVEGDSHSPLDFCTDSMRLDQAGATNTGLNSVAAYSSQDTRMAEAFQCGAVYGTYPPPSPAPPLSRENEADSHPQGVHACAATMQYGLFEQGRLFGIPDVLGSFVIDNRVHPNLHFIGKLVYDYMYVKPTEKAGDILADPKSKLEMYIAYRLSSTSIWAILVANVAGYMMVRALAPMGVHILKLVGFKTNVVKYKDPNGPYGDIYEEIVLVRPQIGWPVYLAMGVTVLAIYWILWVDPATQSHYYTTPTCEDWKGLGVQVPSGAFSTTWGKRRYGRFGEHLIGVLLAITLFLILFVIGVGKTFVPAGALKEAAQVDVGTTARLDTVALIMIGFALVLQILFITQSIVSGDAWYQAVKASDNDAVALDVFTKDVWMSVWAAFWTSASIAWYRQKWAVDKLNFLLQLAWMASALLLLWMPVLQSAALLDNELDDAFSDGKGTKDTSRLIIYIFIYAFSAIWTVVLGLRLKAMWDALPERAAALANSAARVAKAKGEKRRYLEGIEAAAVQASRDAQAREAFGPDGLTFAPASRLKFDLSAMQVSPAGIPVRPGSKTDAVYMPLMPKH